VSASTFPELHKALYAHLTPPAAHERDLSSTPRLGLPPPSPSAPSPSAAASSHAPSPASTPDARFGASPFASTRIPSAVPSAVPSAGAARPARPASAGGNGLKLAGLSSLPREDPYPSAPGTARDERTSAVPGGMPKLGGGGGLSAALGGAGAGAGAGGGGGMSKLNLGKISSDHRAEDDGSMSQHERLRIYAKQCSQILPNLYLGADEVAKDLSVRG